MKFFKKTGVAVTVLIISIAFSLFLGSVNASIKSILSEINPRLDFTLDYLSYDQFISDDVQILTERQKDLILLYNANWDQRYGRVVAFVSTAGLNGQTLEDYAYNRGASLGLGESDAILVYDIDGDQYFVAPGDHFADFLLIQQSKSSTPLCRILKNSRMASQRFIL
ncbi:TPM domain-containing protein [Anaerotruncus colihominis]|uniref:TPM domain-containing protein n=1 Tax=Anaerotruncus colihominis TaxID=169435 RepID=UPI0035137A87